MPTWIGRKYAQLCRILVDAIERYTRILAEDTRDIKKALEQNEQQLEAIDAGIKQSLDLAMKNRDEHVRSVARLESSIGNIQTDMESQTAQESSRERRKCPFPCFITCK